MRSFMILVLLGVLAGCPGRTPIETQYNAQEGYIFALRAALLLRDLGRISPETWRETYLPIIELGDATLDQMDLARRAGKLNELRALRDILTQTIESLETLNTRVEASNGPSSDLGSGVGSDGFGYHDRGAQWRAHQRRAA